MAKTRILDKAVDNEVRRTVLKEAEERYRHEMLSDEERQVVHDRVLNLRRELGLR
jgi:hypothetical protein